MIQGWIGHISSLISRVDWGWYPLGVCYVALYKHLIDSGVNFSKVKNLRLDIWLDGSEPV